jgi:N-carbamoyl-L-amino-acid hydrolase
MSAHHALRIDRERLWASLMRSAEIGPGVAGGLRRLALSDADRAMRDQFVDWCRAAGATPRVDAAGNVFARAEGRAALPPVLVGSHLDTQVTGGRFDGILGVLAGLEILRTLRDAGHTPRRPIEVVNWTNEEGARFPPPMAASAVFAGLRDLDWLYALRDDDGLAFGDELARIGYKGDAPVGGTAHDAYFELHIEQGDVLHRAGVPVGIVTGAYPSEGMNVAFVGETAHSGPTPMAKRRNALIGAAYLATAVNEIGWRHAPTGKASAARLVAWPNKSGILPSLAEITVDMRHADLATKDAMVAEARAAIAEASRRARVDAEVRASWSFGNERFDPDCQAILHAAAARLGHDSRDLPSQAGHDAYYISRVVPTAMLFCPCIDGITHNEAEDVDPAPTFAAADTLLQAVLDRAERG